MIMGGMVLETNLQEIVSRFQEQQKIAKSEVTRLVGVDLRDFTKMKFREREFFAEIFTWIFKFY